MSYWTYTAMLDRWNARHDPDGDHEPVAPPTAEFVAARQSRLTKLGQARSVN